MNNVVLSGNLTRDPELVETSGGTSLARFTVAVNESRKVNDEWVDVAHFVDVTAFGRRGELLAEKGRKGDFVSVLGRLDYRAWETDDGQKRNKLGVVAREMEGELFFRKAGEAPAKTAAKPSAPAPQTGTPAADDDDIPF